MWLEAVRMQDPLAFFSCLSLPLLSTFPCFGLFEAHNAMERKRLTKDNFAEPLTATRRN